MTPASLRIVGQLMRTGRVEAAIGALRGGLGEDPDDAEAHALLSICLHDQKRIATAETEALLALRLDPTLDLGRKAMVYVHIARGRRKEAHALLDELLAEDPSDEWYLTLRGRLYRDEERFDEAFAAFGAAREAAPDDPDPIAELGTTFLQRGRVAEARRCAEDALGLDAQDADSLLLMGWVCLREGQAEEARDHAIQVLRVQPDNEQALRLIGSIKAKENPILGLWWSWNMRLRELGSRSTILVLLGAWLFVRLASQVLFDLGEPEIAASVSLVWLGICVWTWVSPGYFRKLVEKELESIRLREDF